MLLSTTPSILQLLSHPRAGLAIPSTHRSHATFPALNGQNFFLPLRSAGEYRRYHLCERFPPPVCSFQLPVLGGLPSCVVNATTNQQVATTMKWTADWDVRVVARGTGHELSGRSSGALGLSIWTRHLRELKREKRWNGPGQDGTEDVFVVGSKVGWGSVLDFALA